MARDPHTRATLARARLIYQLRASEEPGAAALAAVLAACTNAAPCRSAACPVCGLAFQRAALSLVDRFIRVPARAIRSRMTALTIVPETGCLAPDSLTTAAIEKVGAEVLSALADLCFPSTIVGLEVSFNEDTTGRLAPHWCAHAHGIGYDWLSVTQEQGLRAAFPPSPNVRRPVHWLRLDQREQGRLYPFKPERVRRVTSLETDDPQRAPYRTTKRRHLRPKQAASLAVIEHRLGFSGRLQTHGVDEGAVRQHLRACGWARDGP